VQRLQSEVCELDSGKKSDGSDPNSSGRLFQCVTSDVTRSSLNQTRNLLPAMMISYYAMGGRRSQWPRGLMHEMSSTARTLGSWVRIPLEAQMPLWAYSVFVLSCVRNSLVTG
jgi:hypothetical protein